MKKLLRIIGFIFIGLLIAMIVLPYVFKDRILEEVKDYAETQVNAKVDFTDVDLSLFRSFPKASVKILDLQVTGINDFEDVLLAKADVLALDLSIAPLFNSDIDPEIAYVGLESPVLNVVVLKDGKANYDITKPSEDESSFFTPLNKYEVTNGTLRYHDRSSNILLDMVGLDHSGSGTLSEAVFDLDTQSDIRSLTAEVDGTTYLYKVPASLSALINVDLEQSKYTLKNNKLKLNGLSAEGDGSIQLSGEDMIIDAKVRSLGESFKNFLALVPYLPALNNVSTSGTASVNANINGTYNGATAKYPAFEINVNVTNGQVQYPDLPKDLSNISGKIKVKSTLSNMSDLIIDIPGFKMNIGGDPVSGNLLVQNGTSTPRAKGQLLADIKLEDLKQAISIEGLQQLAGSIESDIKFDVAMADVEAENYDKIDASGSFQVSDLILTMEGRPSLSLNTASAQLSPSICKIVSEGLTVGTSKMNLSGEIQNPISIVHNDVSMQGTLNIVATEINLNEWMSDDAEASNDPSPEVDFTSSEAFDVSKYNSSSLIMDVKVDKVIYEDYDIKDFRAKGKLGPQKIDLQRLATTVNGSDLDVSGSLANPVDYVFNNETLRGTINLTSQKINLNTLMPTAETTSSTSATSESNILIPDNIVVDIISDIGTVIYGDMKLDKVRGEVKVADQTADLEGISAGILGGRVKLSGLYNTAKEVPTFDMKVDLQKLTFQDAYKQFVTVRKLAPIAEYLTGIFNTTIVLNGKLGADMTPQFDSFNASGVVETLNGIIKGLKPLQEVSSKLGVSELERLNLERTINWFEIKNGQVEIKPFEKKVKDINLAITGTHSLTQEMDYTIIADIPRSKLQNSSAGNLLNSGLGFLEKEAGKLGVDIDQGDMIKLKVNLGGSITKPKVAIVPLGSSGKSIEDEVKEEINDQIDKAKDSVKTVVKQTTDKVIDSVNTRVEDELDKAKDVAKDKANVIVDKAKDKVKDKVGAQIDTLLGESVSDSLLDKASEVLKDKTGTSVEDIKDKLEDWNPFKKKKKKKKKKD